MSSRESEQVRPLRADARRNRTRILDAAEAVFAERGPVASTEEVAVRAGVAIGTVFRHFPTKKALLVALVKDLLARLTDAADALIVGGDPATGLFMFFEHVVEQAAAQKTVVDLLAEAGVDVEVAGPVHTFGQAVGTLLERATEAGAVREDVELDEVLALLTATGQGALRAGWSPVLQGRVLAIVFDGLRLGAGAGEVDGWVAGVYD